MTKGYKAKNVVVKELKKHTKFKNTNGNELKERKKKRKKRKCDMELFTSEVK